MKDSQPSIPNPCRKHLGRPLRMKGSQPSIHHLRRQILIGSMKRTEIYLHLTVMMILSMQFFNPSIMHSSIMAFRLHQSDHGWNQVGISMIACTDSITASNYPNLQIKKMMKKTMMMKGSRSSVLREEEEEDEDDEKIPAVHSTSPNPKKN